MSFVDKVLWKDMTCKENTAFVNSQTVEEPLQPKIQTLGGFIYGWVLKSYAETKLIKSLIKDPRLHLQENRVTNQRGSYLIFA